MKTEWTTWIAVVIVGGLIAWTVRAMKRAAPSAPAPTAAPIEGDPIVGPAYKYLQAWTTAERAALYQAQKALGLPIEGGALPTVIEHESGGDPAAPHEASGTPRGGLIQLTQGARLPGFDTADKVWAIRTMSVEDQIQNVVLPFYKRWHDMGDGSATTLVRRNFLPGVASKPADTVLGVKDGATGPNGETASTPLIAGQSLTLGQIFAANPGFARGKDFFTWADVDADTQKTLGRAGGKWIRVSGKVENAIA
jgi:hypothetical protein